jgi:hypothetical protein
MAILPYTPSQQSGNATIAIAGENVVIRGALTGAVMPDVGTFRIEVEVENPGDLVLLGLEIGVDGNETRISHLSNLGGWSGTPAWR